MTVYLHGFGSSPLSKKAQWFQARFTESGIPIRIPDLAAGDFEHLTITGQLSVIDELCGGEPVTLMGSSLGGYLAALYAARHPAVERVVLMAPAFCFGRRCADVFGPRKCAEWERTGSMQVFHYGEGRERPLDYGLIRDAANYEDYPRVNQPTLIFHGLRDDLVPPELSREFVARNPHARLRLLDSDHELTDSVDAMWRETQKFLELRE